MKIKLSMNSNKKLLKQFINWRDNELRKGKGTSKWVKPKKR